MGKKLPRQARDPSWARVCEKSRGCAARADARPPSWSRNFCRLCEFFAFVPQCSEKQLSSCDFFAFVPYRRAVPSTARKPKNDHRRFRRSAACKKRSSKASGEAWGRTWPDVGGKARRSPQNARANGLRLGRLVQKRKKHTGFDLKPCTAVHKRKNHTGGHGTPCRPSPHTLRPPLYSYSGSAVRPQSRGPSGRQTQDSLCEQGRPSRPQGRGSLRKGFFRAGKGSAGVLLV